MSRRLLEYDAQTKKTDYIHTDTDGNSVIESVQDAEDIVKFNALAGDYLDKSKDWWFVGSVPLVLCQEWATESGTNVFTKPWQEYAKKKMQSAEFQKLNPNRIKF